MDLTRRVQVGNNVKRLVERTQDLAFDFANTNPKIANKQSPSSMLDTNSSGSDEDMQFSVGDSTTHNHYSQDTPKQTSNLLPLCLAVIFGAGGTYLLYDKLVNSSSIPSAPISDNTDTQNEIRFFP